MPIGTAERRFNARLNVPFGKGCPTPKERQKSCDRIFTALDLYWKEKGESSVALEELDTSDSLR